MKKHLCFLLTSLIICTTVQAQWQRPPQTPNDTLKSTHILKNGDVVFSIYAPDAETVTLGGDAVPWGAKITGTKQENGVWTLTVPNIKTGTYRYHFIVDGVKVYDPKAPGAKETSALLDIIPAGEKEFFALRKNIPHGAVSHISYYSSVSENMRRMHIWTPPEYNVKSEKLPVLYLIHGGGDSDLAWPTVGRAGFIMDNLLSEEKCKRMIVVMPDGGMDADLFTDELTKVIIPYIEKNYTVHTDSQNRAIAGLSMGGLETLNSFMSHPDMFAYINVMSSGWFTNNKKMYEEGDKRLTQIADTLNKTVKYLVFTQGGPEDIAYNNGKEMLKIFDRNKIKYDSSEMPGGHTWYVWRHDLKNFAQKLFKN